ncbi:LytTR family DNA-binding domain-containing protein [Flammeovirga sp. EKP202]|uniref:LytR/AlgR family response regulator transcription factor n=1 Tax=Flammeovirga sp. EKP202 TaxID=2770592 RepID=UPI00165F0FBF|nr:LytTR family DNA-binding domain-containing protein [Flammeovirga sp. EKP202]MBD0402310.1 response regulator transcription factor [Flammeovirga sp. EKP202]
MKALIIEDEKPAQAKLKRQLSKTPFDIEVVDTIDNVEEACSWLEEQQESIDLVFMDIHLTDGIAFDILSNVTVTTPIIFTTAYDEYALDAFKVNSIDYLLKPVDYEALTKALQKLQVLQNNQDHTATGQIDALLDTYNQKFKKRFMVRVGDNIKSIQTEEIAAFGAESRDTFLYTTEGRRYIVDFKMEQLEEMLDQNEFYRTGRSFIIHRNSITNIQKHSNSRLLVDLAIETHKEIIVGRDKVKDFKEWIS